MRNTLLITVAVAALAAGAGLASAQSVNERHDPAGAVAPEHKVPVPAGKVGQEPGAPNAAHSVAPPLAQTPLAPAQGKAKQAPLAAAPEKDSDGKRETLGQGTGSQSPLPLRPRDEQSLKPGASVVPLSTEQHARIRETMRAEKVERLSNVQFPISVGEAVPRTVHLYSLPARIVDYAPQYRDYEYILVGDDILIVDPRTFRIIAVIAS